MDVTVPDDLPFLRMYAISIYNTYFPTHLMYRVSVHKNRVVASFKSRALMRVFYARSFLNPIILSDSNIFSHLSESRFEFLE